MRDYFVRSLQLDRSIMPSNKGLILADTKFEFGIADNDLIIVVDEMATPDSSRYWDAQTYAPGRAQLHRWINSGCAIIWKPWNGTKPRRGRICPPDVVAGTRAKYVEAYDRLTGLAVARPRRAGALKITRAAIHATLKQLQYQKNR